MQGFYGTNRYGQRVAYVGHLVKWGEFAKGVEGQGKKDLSLLMSEFHFSPIFLGSG